MSRFKQLYHFPREGQYWTRVELRVCPVASVDIETWRCLGSTPEGGVRFELFRYHTKEEGGKVRRPPHRELVVLKGSSPADFGLYRRKSEALDPAIRRSGKILGTLGSIRNTLLAERKDTGAGPVVPGLVSEIPACPGCSGKEIREAGGWWGCPLCGLEWRQGKPD